MSRPLILLFGGQSSRDPGMFDRLETVHPRIGATARERAAHFAAGDPTDFSTNRTIQVSVLAVTLGWLEVVMSNGLGSAASAGLSLGEYAHLVDIGAIEADHALDLVMVRGTLYDQGPDGAMTAVFPIAWDELGPVVQRIADAHGGPTALAPAVFNSPSQTVVAGSHAAVAMLADAADQELYAHAVMVEHRIPMHTPRFEPVAKPFRAALEAAPWKDRARLAYRPNVTATATQFDLPTVLDCLTRHVYQPVMWRHTVDSLAAEYPDAVFLEIGPRTVVRDLMLRRWLVTRDVFAVDSPDEGIEGAPERVAATLDQVRYALMGGAASRPSPMPRPVTGSAR